MTELILSLRIKDVIDILCVAFLLFYVYRAMKRSGSLNMFIGILMFVFIWILVSLVFNMKLLGAIFNKLVDVGVIAIIILFANEIRQFFRAIGTTTRARRLFRWLIRRDRSESDAGKWEPVISACMEMGEHKVGALIVIGDEEELREIKKTGEYVNAEISKRLIQNIFFKNTPLHDGAMLICDGRIDAAACILPVSKSEELPLNFGLRHRAAMGITEQTRAIAIVVSEETGHITVFHNSSYMNIRNAQELQQYLADNN